MSDGERLATVAEVAERVGLGERAIRRAIERGELPASKLCGRVRVRPEDAEAWIEQNRVQPRIPPAVPRRLTAPATNGLRELLEAPLLSDSLTESPSVCQNP